MKVLFVEDDPYTCELIAGILDTNRYAVDIVADGETGLEMAIQWPYDLILLDVMLPKLNGIEVCRQLRSRACQTPVLMLTARGASQDVISGLDAGADDYVVKSCEPDQLLARVRALLRRGGEVSSRPLLTWGDLCLDPASAQVTFQQAIVPCRPREYTLLELFLRNPQRLLSRSNIIDNLWSFDDAPVEGSVTTLIKDLRHRLKAAGMAADPIETVYGLGYRLKPGPSKGGAGAIASSRVAAVAMGESSSTAKVQAALQAAGAKFRASWPQRLATLAQAEQAIQAGDLSLKQLQEILSQVHKLAGGLGTFGYDQAAAIAETLEQSIRDQMHQQTHWSQHCLEALDSLQQELSPPAPPEQHRAPATEPVKHRE
ncbi:response regulator [Halomicronema sp. CCY15110]|uniref:response regulator n=1 Tax=Halomicronema sp. CCY15110 TaxID=2767773 RepID=UPI00194FEDFE|nr:response regulator [Halomicronema sp. CCY15110]